MKSIGKTLLFAILLLLSGCGHNKSVQNNDIIVIRSTEQVYQDTVYVRGIPIFSSAPVFTVKDAETGNATFKVYDYTQDTLSLRNDAERVILTYRYNPMEEMDAVVHGGDTLMIGIEKGIPYIRVKGDEHSGTDYDWKRICRYGLKDGFCYETLVDVPFLISGEEDYPIKIEKAKDLLFKKLENESSWLDSLWKTGKLDDLEYRYFKERNKYSRLLREVGSLTPEQMREILSTYSDDEYRKEPFGFYRRYMDDLFKRVYFVKWITGAQSSDPDYRQIFDLISADTLVAGRLKDTHLYNCMEGIANSCSHADGRLYYGKALEEIKDTALLGNMRRKYGDFFSKELEISNDLQLLSPQGDTLMLADLIDRLSGKVIYLDVWASWCEPCRREIPASKELHEKYAGKDVEFVYLALGDKKDKWQAALTETGLNQMKEVYLVLNSNNNTWTEMLEIKTIPRFIIYDKTGKLVNANAPRPSTSEIRQELDRYLE